MDAVLALLEKIDRLVDSYAVNPRIKLESPLNDLSARNALINVSCTKSWASS